MIVPWRLLEIDFVGGDFSEYSASSYSKLRKDQLHKWRENNYSDSITYAYVDMEHDVSIQQQLKETNHPCKHEGIEDHTEIVSNTISIVTKTERKLKTKKIFRDRKKRSNNPLSLFQSRAQKAKENFTKNNKKFLLNAIEEYKKHEKDIQLNIPNIKAAIQLAIESLSFPKDILQELRRQNGSGCNGKLCNLEAGWQPMYHVDYIPDDRKYHILPYHIKETKTMDERRKERKENLKRLKKGSDKSIFDPIVALPYLFS